MIKIFRKFRQNLLIENKTSKYFKYAIGEIVLVVIGILIGLSINNWNETRKKSSLTKNYRLKLIEELDSHIIKVSFNARASLRNCISEINKKIKIDSNKLSFLQFRKKLIFTNFLYVNTVNKRKSKHI